MQVNLPATSAPGVAVSRTNALMLPNLLKLTKVSPQAEALREQRDEKQREHRQQLAAAGLIPNGSTRAVFDAERRMAPTSRAAQRQMLADNQQKAAQQQSAFQRTLVDAREAGRTPSGTAPETKTRTPEASSTQPTRTAPSREDSAGSSPQKTAGDPPKPNASTERPQPANPPNLKQSSRNTARAAPSSPAATESAARRPATRAPATVTGARSAVARAGQLSSAKAGGPSTSGAAKPGAPTAAATDGRTRTARATPTATTPARSGAQATRSSDANVERVLRLIRSQIGRDRVRATLRLDPPELGTVRLRLDLRKDVLSLRIDTQTTMAHRLLTEQIESLRQGLHATGIELERVEIRPPATPAAEASDLPQQPGDRQTDRDRSPDTDAEHSSSFGTDSSPAELADGAAREAIPEPATESLVNILA